MPKEHLVLNQADFFIFFRVTFGKKCAIIVLCFLLGYRTVGDVFIGSFVMCLSDGGRRHRRAVVGVFGLLKDWLGAVFLCRCWGEQGTVAKNNIPLLDVEKSFGRGACW